jgi:hypothetical protein
MVFRISKNINFLKSKAMFQIFVLVFAIFSVYLMTTKEVRAEEEKVCCEETIEGGMCVYTNEANCKTGALRSSVSCEQTSFCKLGCCIDGLEGSCGSNVPKASCEKLENSVFYDSSSCSSLEFCDMGCCEIGNNYRYTTKRACGVLIDENFPLLDVEEAWDPSFSNEFECIYQIVEEDEGCCVEEGDYGFSGTCDWTTRSGCETLGEEDSSGGNGFYQGIFCSDEKLNCDCVAKDHKGCDGVANEDVYWFDSCGNREDLVEECDYIGGTICREDDNDAYCASLNCNDVVTDGKMLVMNPHYQETGIDDGVKHGESWCSYESGVGGHYDRPGSRHYRHICFMGVELVQECRDFREEICLQSEVNLEYNGGTSTAIYSACIDNEIYDSIITPNISLVPKGGEFWESNYQTECNLGNVDCDVYNLKKDKFSDWECKANCECQNQNFIDQSALYCKSKGDCGDDYNVPVKYSDEGLIMKWGGTSECVDSDGDKIINGCNDVQSSAEIGRWARYGIFSGMKDLANSLEYDGDVDESDYSYNPMDRIFGDLNAQTVLIASYVAGVTAASFSALGGAGSLQYGTTAVGEAMGSFFSSSSGSGIDASLSTFGVVVGVVMAVYGLIAGDYVMATQGTIIAIGCAFGGVGCVVGAALAVVAGMILGKSKVREKNFDATCNVWQPPYGGNDCEKCDNDPRYSKEYYDNPVICSEYRCKSLGKTCELVNEGTDNAKCVNVNPNDVAPPAIRPWKKIIEDQGYTVEETSGGCEGYRVEQKVRALEKFSFGVETNEAAKCKYDFEHVETFNEMEGDFDEGYFSNSQNVTKFYPGGQDYTFYVKCIDAAGNENSCDYTIEFSTINEPDYTAPIVLDTSIPNGGAIAYGLNETPLVLYMNEPVEICRWDRSNVPFDQMVVNNSFFCGCYAGDTSACTGTEAPEELDDLCDYIDEDGLFIYEGFECVGLLDNVIPMDMNTYYISCVDIEKEDKSGCNINTNYEFKLQSTSPLKILNVEPENGTYYYPEFVLRVLTTGGVNNGIANCYYDDGFGRIEFFETGSNIHIQEQTKIRGDYEYFIECEDLVGNKDNWTLDIKIEADTNPPIVENLYSEGGYLHLITNEESTCEYSVKDGNFGIGDGEKMSGEMIKSHSLAMVEDIYYVRCYDVFDNIGGVITVHNA